MDPNDWLENVSRSVMGTFYSRLLAMATSDMNRLSIGAYPVWARRIMNEERRRRKEQGGSDDSPTKAERKRILSIGESGSGGAQHQQPQQQRQEQQQAQSSNLIRTNEGGSQKQSRKKKSPTVPASSRTHIDGGFLHNCVAQKSTYHLVYAAPGVSFSANKSRVGCNYGHFTCTTPSCNGRPWSSRIITTELDFSTATGQYRTTLHSQRCNECETYAEPKVDPEKYAAKVVHVLDLWTGIRSPLPRSEFRPAMGPHDQARCHGCVIGICAQDD